MIQAIVILILAAPPGLYPVPAAVRPYVHLLRNEPEFVGWWLQRRDSVRPLIDFSRDPGMPVRKRQQAWQMWQKLRHRKE
ncbi:MAG TPA: hypothetical protein PLF11_11025 [Bacillota bacterium]|mgnify:FL=1|nr:hypothetical protein [Bacillota bacterium]